MILDQHERILGILQTSHHPGHESNDDAMWKNKVPLETIEALQCLEAELDADPGLKSKLVRFVQMYV